MSDNLTGILYQCPVCGGTLVGDGYTIVSHCECVEPPDGAEADSGPWYCDPTDFEELE